MSRSMSLTQTASDRLSKSTLISDWVLAIALSIPIVVPPGNLNYLFTVPKLCQSITRLTCNGQTGYRVTGPEVPGPAGGGAPGRQSRRFRQSLTMLDHLG